MESGVITKTTCDGCEFKHTRNCPYYGPNEVVRIAECEGKSDLNCNHVIKKGN